MAEKVQLEIEIKGGDTVGRASEKVQSLRSQLKEMKAELASGNLSTEAFNKLSIKAGELQDRIGDVNQRVKNLASDTGKLDGFVSVATGIAGGFAAAQGAMALFGDENKDLQKTLLKVQGAVALLNGFQAVANTLNKDSAASTLLLGNANLFNSVKTTAAAAATTLYTFVTNGATVATKAFRAALLATGIGAIIVLLGALAVAMANAGDETDETTEKIKRQNEELEKHKQLVKEDADKLSESRAMRKGGLNDMERELKLLKAKGASDKEVFAQEQKILQERRALLNLRLGYVSGNAEEIAKIEDDLKNNTNEIEASKLAYYKKIQDDKLKAAELAASKAKKQENKIAQEQNDAQVKAYEKFKEEEDKQFFEELERLMEYDQAVADLDKEEQKRREEARLKQLEYDKQAADARLQITADGLDALIDITNAFTGKNEAGQRRAFAINKALNISTTLIDTYMAAQKAYASQLSVPSPDAPVRAQVAAGIAVANGLARVAAISATQFGSSSRGGSGGGGGSRNVNTNPDIQGFQTTNRPAQTGADQPQQIKVFVTETDIRNVGNKTSSIYSQATVE